MFNRQRITIVKIPQKTMATCWRRKPWGMPPSFRSQIDRNIFCRMVWMNFTLCLCQNSYWQWPSRNLVDFPIKNGGSFQFATWNYQRVISLIFQVSIFSSLLRGRPGGITIGHFQHYLTIQRFKSMVPKLNPYCPVDTPRKIFSEAGWSVLSPAWETVHFQEKKNMAESTISIRLFHVSSMCIHWPLHIQFTMIFLWRTSQVRMFSIAILCLRRYKHGLVKSLQIRKQSLNFDPIDMSLQMIVSKLVTAHVC